jgi:hypothetical protein
MWSTIFYGFLGSAIFGFIYLLLFAQREDKIRSYLSKKRRGLMRRRYVNAFVGAVRGKAATTDTAILAFIVLFVPLVMSVYLQRRAQELEGLISETRTKMEKFESHDQMQPHVDKEVADLKDRLTEFEKGAHKLILSARVMAWALIAAFSIGLWFWLPFLVMRRGFDHELQRFTLRIQGLASKSEIAELAVAESKVKNEETLRHFFEVTRKIAERHNILELVSTFNLWGDQETA